MSIDIADLNGPVESEALTEVRGGISLLGQGQSKGDVVGAIGIAGGGISLFSPTIAINTVVDASLNLQLANIIEESLDISTITNSVLV